MSDPLEPPQAKVAEKTAATRASRPAPAPCETMSTLAENGRPGSGPDSEPEDCGPATSDTLSTLADGFSLAPAEMLAQSVADCGGNAVSQTIADSDAEALAQTVADPGGTMPVDGASALTDEVMPSALAVTFLDGTEPGAGRAGGQVAGYEILGVLGRGAMGVVYKARQRGLKRTVALKMIGAGAHCSPADLARFQSEAVAVAALQHPNIVQIYEVGEDRGNPFFSLEYVEGDSLAKKINGTPQPPRGAAHLVQALAGGMHYAHERGIIHRDLKPANVLLTVRGEPKVTDFGLVKRLEDDSAQTQSGSILGTPSYMAPEQAEGKIKEIGPHCDIYGLGGILYELLTGRPPFRAASILDTLQQVRTQEPIPPSQFQPKLPRDLETICLKCLQKDAAKRYATAAALGEDLRRFLAGETILARPVSRAERLWRWCRRNKRVALLAAAVAILIVGWAATSTLLFRLARSNEQAALANARAATHNALLARHNAKEAQSKAEEALSNAEAARRNAAQAKANEARARSQEQAAKGIAQDSIAQMIRLGEQVMRRLRNKHDPAQAEAELVRLRDDLLTMLRKEMVPLAERIEANRVSPFGYATLHQRLGDLFRRLGQFEDARREYQQGRDRLARVTHAEPQNDMARANLGVMLMRLGEVALEQCGDAAAARREFGHAWTIQQQVALHPRSGAYSDTDNLRILSGIAIKEGVAELALGHPHLARERFQKALDLRREWTLAQPDNVSARSYRSEAELWLGVAYSHSGDWKNARRHLEEAIQICTVLADRYPADRSFKGDLASVHFEHGAALLRAGQNDEAREAFNQALKYARIVLARDPEEMTARQVTAAASERLGELAQKHRQPLEAARLFKTALEIRTELAQSEPGNVPARAERAIALAHASRYDEAMKTAAELDAASADRPAILVSLARCFAVCARDDSHRGRAKPLAAGALAAAVRSGYRDLVAISTDPDFSELISDPELKKLLGGVNP